MRITQSIRLMLLTLLMLTICRSAPAQIGFGVSITVGPPALPVYTQPLCPGEGYIWTPGYWAYADGDYYWVPGTWVMAPEVGLLWTPGYWGWGGAAFIFHEGYWGPVVGFYGGINYGFGYFGQGYQGGRWNNGQFYYNRTVNNINITNIHNVYTTQVTNTTVSRVSYNGGNGGINAQPSAQDQAAARERHISPVAAQTQQAQAARSNQQLCAAVNHGKPPIAATPRPGAFNESGVIAAKQAGGPYHPAANRAAAPQANEPAPRSEPPVNRTAAQPRANEAAPRPGNGTPRPNPAVHPNDLPPNAPLPRPNTGNAQRDRQYQQQQGELRARQNQQRQELQQNQEQEHQQLAQQKANEARKQQVEQQHQQQTQQLQQKHAAETKQMQEEQRQHQARAPKQEHPPTEKP
jgi:hypothetical protein